MTDEIDLSGGDIDITQVNLDIDDDGIIDTSIINLDVDGDGVADISITEIDIDGDGVADIVGIDSDGDGVVDIEGADIDGDGVADIFQTVDQADSIWGGTDIDQESSDAASISSMASLGNSYSDMSFSGYEALSEIHGTPIEDMALWDEQDDPMSCAVATTNMMFRSVGINGVSESELANTLEGFGVYDPATGSNPEILDDAINIMAANNGLDIEEHNFSSASLDDYEEMLDNGICPLLAVDGAELYEGGFDRFLNDLGLLPNAPHAIQLTGIEHSPDGDFAIINDPGFPDGAGQRIPIDAFMDAAEDREFSGVYVQTSEMAENFSGIAGMSDTDVPDVIK